MLHSQDICLDDFLGRSKPPAIAMNPVQSTIAAQKVGSTRSSFFSRVVKETIGQENEYPSRPARPHDAARFAPTEASAFIQKKGRQ